MSTEREILIALCFSLTTCDHIGDVSEAVYAALKKIGIEPPDDVGDEFFKLGTWLEENYKIESIW